LYEDEDDNEFAPWLDANLMKLFPGLDQTQYQDTDEFLNYIGPYQYEIMRFAFRSASRLTEFRLLPAEIMWSSIHYVFSHWKRFPELDQYTDLPVAFLFFLSRKTVIIVLNGMGFSKLNNQYQKWFDHFKDSNKAMTRLRNDLENLEWRAMVREQGKIQLITKQLWKLKQVQERGKYNPIMNQAYYYRPFWTKQVMRGRATAYGPCPVDEWNDAMQYTLAGWFQPTVPDSEMAVYIRLAKASSAAPSGSFGSVSQYFVMPLRELQRAADEEGAHKVEGWAHRVAAAAAKRNKGRPVNRTVPVDKAIDFCKWLVFSTRSICIKHTHSRAGPLADTAVLSSRPNEEEQKREHPDEDNSKHTLLGIQTLFNAEKHECGRHPVWSRLVDVYRSELSTYSKTRQVAQIVMEGMTMDLQTMKRIYAPRTVEVANDKKTYALFLLLTTYQLGKGILEMYEVLHMIHSDLKIQNGAIQIQADQKQVRFKWIDLDCVSIAEMKENRACPTYHDPFLVGNQGQQNVSRNIETGMDVDDEFFSSQIFQFAYMIQTLLVRRADIPNDFSLDRWIATVRRVVDYYATRIGTIQWDTSGRPGTFIPQGGKAVGASPTEINQMAITERKLDDMVLFNVQDPLTLRIVALLARVVELQIEPSKGPTVQAPIDRKAGLVLRIPKFKAVLNEMTQLLEEPETKAEFAQLDFASLANRWYEHVKGEYEIELSVESPIHSVIKLI